MRSLPMSFAALLLAATVEAATPRLLFKAGDATADGVHVGAIGQVVADGTQIGFVGDTGAIVVQSGTSTTVVARTGDLLPPPLLGTFGQLSAPRINDAEQVVFKAGVNSAQEASRLFFYDQGTIRSVSVDTRAYDLDNTGRVVYGAANGVRAWTAAAGTTTIFRRRSGSLVVRNLVASDGGAVALQAELSYTNPPRRVAAIIASTSTGKWTVFARDGDPSPLGAPYEFGRRSNVFPVAINAGGQVAFVVGLAPSGGAVFLATPGGSVSAVTRVGDAVGGQTITALGNAFVGVDSHGAVAFQAVLGSPPAATSALVLAAGGTLAVLVPETATVFAPRLTEAGAVVWADRGRVERFDGSLTLVASPTQAAGSLGLGFAANRPSINNAGAVAYDSTREALYLIGAGAPAPVVTAGDPGPAGGTIADIGGLAFRAGTLVFFASEDATHRVLAVRRGIAPPAHLVRTGDPSPLRGVVDLDNDALDVDASGVVFASTVSGGTSPAGVFRADLRGGALRALAKTGTRAPDGSELRSFDAVAAYPGGAVFRAGVSEETDAAGLFVVRRKRLRKIAVAGDHAPGGGRFDRFGTPAVDRNHVLFAATLLRGRVGSALFLWSPGGGLVRVVAGGGRVRGGGRLGGSRYDRILFEPNALAHRSLVFLGPDPDSPSLFFRRRGRPVRLVRYDTPTDAGRILSFGNTLALGGNDIAFTARVLGTAAKQALFSVTP